MNKGFYNTVGDTGDELKKNERITALQDQHVLAVFRKVPDSHLSVFDVMRGLTAYGYPEMLRTSVGRSMNTLTKQGLLMKTKVKKLGKYGRNVYTWILSK